MFIKRKKIKLTIITIILLIICGVVGGFKQREATYATRSIKSKIDIGGYGLFVNCYGKGNPTVIFDSGLGGSYGDWEHVQPEISKVTRTFSYSRAGIGSSDSSKLKRTSLNQVYELHTLLKNAKVKGPYIFVVHSIAGYNARLFAGTYPNEVAGIIFVDCAHEKQYDSLKEYTAEEYKEVALESENAEQTFDEQILSANQVKEIRKKDALRNIPIIVLSADENLKPSQDKYEEMMKIMVDTQKDIASLSNKSKYIFVKDSSHYIQLFHPQVVIDAIKEVLNEVKK